MFKTSFLGLSKVNGLQIIMTVRIYRILIFFEFENEAVSFGDHSKYSVCALRTRVTHSRSSPSVVARDVYAFRPRRVHSLGRIRDDFPPAYLHPQRSLAHFLETVDGLRVRHTADGLVVHAQYLVACNTHMDRV